MTGEEGGGTLFQPSGHIGGQRVVASPSERAGRERIMLLAIGAMQERSLLPWVVNQLADPVLARLAGQAIGQILGWISKNKDGHWMMPSWTMPG